VKNGVDGASIDLISLKSLGLWGNHRRHKVTGIYVSPAYILIQINARCDSPHTCTHWGLLGSVVMGDHQVRCIFRISTQEPPELPRRGTIDLSHTIPTRLPEALRSASNQALDYAEDPLNQLDYNPYIDEEWRIVAAELASFSARLETRLATLFDNKASHHGSTPLPSRIDNHGRGAPPLYDYRAFPITRGGQPVSSNNPSRLKAGRRTLNGYYNQLATNVAAAITLTAIASWL
jgi:hypothetical protein